jgi:RNA polymerase sigma-70 factor (ECF subfamily)
MTDASGGFEAFFEAHHVRLFRAMYLVAGSVQDAEELTQDAFLKAWERWDRVKVMENPTGYVFRVAMNGFRSRYRRTARAARRMVGLGGPAGDLFAEADARDDVARAMRGLPPRQRAALVLTEFLEMTSEEAGRLLGVTAASVRALTHQGRVALRTSLADRIDE